MPVNEGTLIQYALGILDARENQAIQRQIAASFELQDELIMIKDTLQYISLAETPIAPSEHTRNKVLSSIHKKTRFDGFIARFAALFDLDQPTSQQLLKKIDTYSANTWESTVFPGVAIMKFPGGHKVTEATCGIVQVKSGTLFPAHEHQGDESNLVLQGYARDDKGNILRAGDLFHLPAGSRHSFRILGDESFIFAVVLEKDNRWLFVKTLVDLLRIKKR
jgi:quercetin dioxygenase-like cupin family protein